MIAIQIKFIINNIPIIYTKYGFENFKNWIKTGEIENISSLNLSDVESWSIIRIYSYCGRDITLCLLHPLCVEE